MRGSIADHLGVGIVAADLAVHADHLAGRALEVDELLEFAALVVEVHEARGFDASAVLVDDGADVVLLLRPQRPRARARPRHPRPARGAPRRASPARADPRDSRRGARDAPWRERAIIAIRSQDDDGYGRPSTPSGRNRAQVRADTLDLRGRRILLMRDQVVRRHGLDPGLGRANDVGLARLGDRGRLRVEHADGHRADDEPPPPAWRRPPMRTAAARAAPLLGASTVGSASSRAAKRAAKPAVGAPDRRRQSPMTW